MAYETEGKEFDKAKIKETTLKFLREKEAGDSIVSFKMCEIDGEVAGFLMYSRHVDLVMGGWCYMLGTAYVAKSHRRKGVFKELYEKLREEVETVENGRAIRLICDKENESAQKSYHSVGMSDSGSG